MNVLAFYGGEDDFISEHGTLSSENVNLPPYIYWMRYLAQKHKCSFTKNEETNFKNTEDLNRMEMTYF